MAGDRVGRNEEPRKARITRKETNGSVGEDRARSRFGGSWSVLEGIERPIDYFRGGRAHCGDAVLPYPDRRPRWVIVVKLAARRAAPA